MTFSTIFVGDVLVAIEEVQQLLAHRVHQLGANLRVAQLVLRLRFEHRVLQTNRHRANHALAHVVALELALGVFVHRLEQALAKRTQVRAAVARVLAVDERIKRLAVTRIAVRETKLQRLARVMQRRINRLRAVRLQILQHEIHQPAPRDESLAVELQLQPRVEVSVMAQPLLDVFALELRVLENLRVRLELDISSIRFRRLALVLFLELALLEARLDELPLAKTAHDEFLRQRIHRLRAHAVQPHAELEHVVIVFRARVNLRHALDDFAQRNAAPEIAHRHARAFEFDLHLLAVAHDVFVDGIVDDLLHQDVATIVLVRPIADAPDVHARAQADVFEGGERLDFALVVNVLLVVSHSLSVIVLSSVRIILRRLQKSSFQVARAVHDSFNAHALAVGAVKNQMISESSAHGERPHTLKLGRTKPPRLTNLRKFNQQPCFRVQKTLGHFNRRVVEIPPILIGDVGFGPARQGNGMLHFAARAFLRMRSSVALL